MEEEEERKERKRGNQPHSSSSLVSVGGGRLAGDGKEVSECIGEEDDESAHFIAGEE